MPDPDTQPALYFEDLAIGQEYGGGEVLVSEAEMLAFAARYDPQPFHVDADAAAQSVFGGIVSSGWFTAALTMQLMVAGAFNFGSGVVGLGIDSLRWPRPVRAGDRLRASVGVMALRASRSQPRFGIAKIRTTTTNQRGEAVQIMVSNVLVRRRSALAPS